MVHILSPLCGAFSFSAYDVANRFLCRQRSLLQPTACRPSKVVEMAMLARYKYNSYSGAGSNAATTHLSYKAPLVAV